MHSHYIHPTLLSMGRRRKKGLKTFGAVLYTSDNADDADNG
jgi:hypothetical protein